MTLSVIIPAYERLADVLHCLNSLQASATPPIEFVIQDDCSPSVDLRSVIPPYAASVVRNERNLGFAGNSNAGAARATGEILLFCNQDVVAHNPLSMGWDKALIAAFENPEVGIVGARLLFPNNTIQSAGGIYDAHLQPAHRCLGYSNIEHWEVNTPEFVPWVTGAALAIRRDLFIQVGGFDEAYAGGYFEDVELCERVKEAGFKVWYEPRVTFVHDSGSSGGNPRFMANAHIWKTRWADTRKVKPDTTAVLNGWW